MRASRLHFGRRKKRKVSTGPICVERWYSAVGGGVQLEKGSDGVQKRDGFEQDRLNHDSFVISSVSTERRSAGQRTSSTKQCHGCASEYALLPAHC
jgi:hypothetical protein